MRKIILFFFLISSLGLVSFNLPGQNAKIDSLINLLGSYKKNDTAKVDLVNDIAWNLIVTGNGQSSEKYLVMSDSLCNELNYLRGLAHLYNSYGIMFSIKGQAETAIEYYNKSLELRKVLKDSSGIGKCFNNIGILYLQKAQYRKAIETHLKSLKIRESLGDRKGMAASFNNIANAYREQADQDNSIRYYHNALEVFKELKDEISEAGVYINLGSVSKVLKKYEECLEFSFRALKLYEKHQDKGGLVYSYINIGEAYKNLNDYPKALEFLLDGFNIAGEINDAFSSCHAATSIGELYTRKGDYLKAKEYLLDAKDLSHKHNYNDAMKESLLALYELYKIQGDHSKALGFHEQYSAIKDSIYNEANIKSINEMQTKYETEKKEKEIELLNKDKDLQEAVINKERLFRNSVLFGLLLVSIMAFFIYSRYSIKRKANFALNQLNNELESLNIQLEKLSLVASHTDSGVMIFDNKYDIEWVNEGFTKLSGYTVQDVIKHGGNLRRISNYENIDAAIESCIVEKKPLIYESLNTMQNGNQVWTQSTLTPVLDENENLKKIVIIESDINKLKHAEEIIRKKNIAITDSIEYAKTIQDTILLPESEIKQHLPESFILFKPKDVVSGDFYWISPLNLTPLSPLPRRGEINSDFNSLSLGEGRGEVLIAAVDCTGHGVPGAFMSLMGYNFLQNAVKENKIERASEILDLVNDEILKMSQQQSGERTIKSGMDMTLVMLDKANNKLQFSGAHNPLYLVRNEELIEIKGDKLSVGDCKNGEKFTNHEIEIKPGDTIYLFSDGFADQLGGPKRKKFYYQPFKELLQSISKMEMEEQKQILDARLTEWRGSIEQIDDVLVMGVKI